jgi:hypothetical protein
MTNHEKELRKIIEHNKRIIEKHYHLNYDKFIKQHSRSLGEYFRSETAKFTDKEMEDAMVLGLAIADKTEPESGLSYEELGSGLLYHVDKPEILPKDYREKIDRLLHVLQYVVFEMGFNTTPEKGNNEQVHMVPVVKWTKKIKNEEGKIEKLDEAVEIIFNGANKKYASEQFEKIGLRTGKISKDELLPEHLQSKSAPELLAEHFDDRYKTDEEKDQLCDLAEKLIKTMDKEYEHVPLKDLLHRVFPETKDMDYDSDDYDPALDPYMDKIKDALFLTRVATNSPEENRKLRIKQIAEKEK